MKKILITILFAALLSSCEKFLEPSSQNEYVPKTVEALYEVLIGDVYLDNKQSSIFYLNEFFSDNISTLNLPEAKVNDNAIDIFYQDKKLYCLHPDMFNPTVDSYRTLSPVIWEESYEKIRSCNAIIDYTPTVSGSQAIKNQVLAEAHLFRALFYFNLVNIYGKPYSVAPDSPGCPIKLDAGFNPQLMERNTVREVYAQVIDDLDKSEQFYKLISKKYRDVSRPSVDLLYALGSRVELYRENWSEAARYAQLVINSDQDFKLYDLNNFIPSDQSRYPSYTNIANPNPETIFAYGDNKTMVLALTLRCDIPKKTGINKTNYVLTVDNFVAAPSLMNSFNDGDLRKRYYSVLEYCNFSPMKGEIEGMHCAYGKMNINSLNETTQTDTELGMSFRLSEMYLNYCEAVAKMGGNDADVIAKMTELLKRRYTRGSENAVVPNLSGEQLVEFIRNERRKELCFEGHRFFDQRRCGMKAFTKEWYEQGELVHSIKVDDLDNSFTLRFKPDILTNNPRIQQNPSWAIKY